MASMFCGKRALMDGQRRSSSGTVGNYWKRSSFEISARRFISLNDVCSVDSAAAADARDGWIAGTVELGHIQVLCMPF